MVGLAFYMFEGVTCILPIYEATQDETRKNFNYLIVGALGFLLVLNIIFSELCYYTFGDDLKEPVIIMQFPDDNWFITVGKLLMCITIIFSFPLQISITNQQIERFLF